MRSICRRSRRATFTARRSISPQAIAIIDGFFEHVPAVWHKEILWAMAQGIHVFGSSSMGALRAAELALFGMEGVGAIFEQVASGQIADDDEVAVAHASASEGFTPLSVALVDMRATFAAAEQQGIIDATTHAALISIAKALYYPRRVYPAVIKAGEAQGLALDALKAWLPAHAISQKRADAILLLETIKRRFAEPVEPKRVRYSFQQTQMWQMVTESAGSLVLDGDQPQHVRQGDVLDELRLSAPMAQALDDAQARARAKQAALAQHDLHNPRLEDSGLSEAALYAWYFDQVGLTDAPPDAAAFAAQAGFADYGRLQARAAPRVSVSTAHIGGICCRGKFETCPYGRHFCQCHSGLITLR